MESRALQAAGAVKAESEKRMMALGAMRLVMVASAVFSAAMAAKGWSAGLTDEGVEEEACSPSLPLNSFTLQSGCTAFLVHSAGGEHSDARVDAGIIGGCGFVTILLFG